MKTYDYSNDQETNFGLNFFVKFVPVEVSNVADLRPEANDYLPPRFWIVEWYCTVYER